MSGEEDGGGTVSDGFDVLKVVLLQDRRQVVDALLGEAGTSGRENYALQDPRLFPRFCVFFWSFEPVN